MSSELLVVEPTDSTSMLGPLFALEVFLARPHRWDASLLDKTFDGIRILPGSRLTTVLSAWTKERGLRLTTIGIDTPLNEQVNAALVFGNETSEPVRSVLGALGVRSVTIDLDSGSMTTRSALSETGSPLAVSPPSSGNHQGALDRRYN